MSLTERIKEKAYELGFDLIGVTPASRAPHAEAYRRWLAQGYQAQMAWLDRDPERREDVRLALPGAQAVVVAIMWPFSRATNMRDQSKCGLCVNSLWKSSSVQGACSRLEP